MVVTWFGRVELDPMRVPVAAAMDRGVRESFAERLDACSREVETAVPEPARDAEVPAPAPAADAAVPEAEDSEESAALKAPARSDQPAALAAATAPAEPALPARANATPDGKPVEGMESAAKPTLAAAASPLTLGATAPGTRSAQPGVALAPATAPAAATATPTVPTAAQRLGAAETIAARTVAPKAAVAGYRTLTPQALQLDEQARDSVFKQILFRLHKDGGEMRLHLDPPELGELDLHLTVEKGNTLRLSIGTDRADLRDLLLSGLRQLENELRQSGLSIAHAEVHTRSEHGRSSAEPWPQSPNARGGDDGVAASPQKHTGWFTAEGLDFWV